MSIKTKLQELANFVRIKRYGVEVRESIAQGLETVGEISENTKDRQDSLEVRFDEQISGNTDINEVIDARAGFPTLSNRLAVLNNYIHPITHAATMITQDKTHKFVTEEQITEWTNKAPTDLATETKNGLLYWADKVKLDKLETSSKGLAISGALDVTSNNNSLSFYPTTNAASYIAWFDPADHTKRHGLIGKNGASADIAMMAEVGSIYIHGQGDTNVISGLGAINLRSAVVRVKNPGGSAFAPIEASAFQVVSDRATKESIVADDTSALEKIRQTVVYNYYLKEEFAIYEKDSDGKVKKLIVKKNEEDVKPRKGLVTDEAPDDIVIKATKPNELDQIDIYAMCALMWKGLQESDARVDELEKKLEEKEQWKGV